MSESKTQSKEQGQGEGGERAGEGEDLNLTNQNCNRCQKWWNFYNHNFENSKKQEIAKHRKQNSKRLKNQWNKPDKSKTC